MQCHEWYLSIIWEEHLPKMIQNLDSLLHWQTMITLKMFVKNKTTLIFPPPPSLDFVWVDFFVSVDIFVPEADIKPEIFFIPDNQRDKKKCASRPAHYPPNYNFQNWIKCLEKCSKSERDRPCTKNVGDRLSSKLS